MSPRPLRLELAPSPPLAAAVAGAHAVAGACAALVAPGWPGGLLAAALSALGLAAAWSRALHRARRSVRALEIDGERLVLVLASGERFDVEPAPRRYVGRLMVAMAVRGSLRRSLLVSADMLPAHLFRALRLWALWGRLPPVAQKQLAA